MTTGRINQVAFLVDITTRMRPSENIEHSTQLQLSITYQDI